MDYTVTTTVFATTSIVGFHFWRDAPHEVRYLADPHRHKFNIRAELAVVENDREVEFHILHRQVNSWLWIMGPSIAGTGEVNFGERSCETIAADLLNELRAQYPGRSLYRMTVDEDGENGATVEAVADEIGERLDSHLERHRDRIERAL